MNTNLHFRSYLTGFFLER